ncbi:MAG: JAB domain-containing protein [SAR202 cluster bacterium]|nr:JAB domain-containing protein [SAR202 cluster bacterium]
MSPPSPVEYTLRIRDMPREERPRERLRHYGASSLSNAELIAILLRTGVAGENVLSLAERLLAQHDGLWGLGRLSYAELSTQRGMGEAKACQVLAALELGRRFASLQPEERATVRSPQDIANLVQVEMSLLEQEHLRVVLLDTKNHVLGIPEVYRGNVNSAVVRAAEVFREAVRQNCPAIIVVHNHPSGDPMPSQEDIQVTQQLVEAGKTLDVELLDHLIIGKGSFLSLKRLGQGFE